jgi:hypothetical protein
MTWLTAEVAEASAGPRGPGSEELHHDLSNAPLTARPDVR